MSTSTTPDIELTVTDNAAVEVRKFMEAEGVTGEEGGLRVSVQPGGCSGFKYSLVIEDKKRGRRFRSRERRLQGLRGSLLGPVHLWSDDRLRHVDAGLGIHVQEPECNWRLRLR